MGVTNATTKFTSDYSGFLGIAPYTTRNKESSFLYNLYNSKKIDTPMVTMHLYNDAAKSCIKLGGKLDAGAFKGNPAFFKT